MIKHCNRTLLAFAAIYLALLPTNTATFARSVSLGVAALFAIIVYGLAARSPATRPRLAGRAVLAPLLIWSLWSVASLAWSIDRKYSLAQLEREVMDSLLVVLIFYLAPYSAPAFRMLVGTALASFAFFAGLAIYMEWNRGGWDPAIYHNGVGPWSTWVVLVAPFLLMLIAPRPVGYGRAWRWLFVALALLGLIVITARMTDNRIVWIALAAVFGSASLVGGLRWSQSLLRTPVRFIVPFLALLVVLALAFADAAKERAAHEYPPDTSLSKTLENDPRIALWEHVVQKIEERPWLGYGFGRRILADTLTKELDNPLLAHAHNAFVSQWLQTGIIGAGAFIALLGGMLWRYARFARSRDEGLAFIGLVGIALIAGFVVKNLTDDFLFRSNAKEFWALSALLLGYGMRRDVRLRAQAPQEPVPVMA
jgi:O-antigen ligase